ncbi:hypothetical protein [uncultured Imperialibacter sp.]|uniref:hypothetical protein n=1 Tax=uncultured Imperialibacter sp. TaxID=1672639 RepID=UPI0030DC3396|tara:strand:- start:50652 stop:51437 length:786 start_codon:yes stop_codon:yes gene_type:complete
MRKNLLLLTGLTVFLSSCGGGDEDATPDCTVSDLVVSIAGSSNDVCGQGIGEIEATATDGAGSYEFSIDGQSFQSSGLFTGLEAGAYTVTVRDANDCMKTVAASLSDEGGLTIEATSTSSTCGSSTGAIAVEATGDGGSFQYRLDDGAFGSASEFTGVSSGLHIVTVKDETGCEEDKEVLVLSGVSFKDQVSSIISTNCAVATCHNGTAGIPNFTSFGAIQENAATIKVKTGNKTMPKVGSLTDLEIQTIACWVDDGAKDN